MKYFVVSDLHGDLDALLHLTKFWNEKEEKLVFIGDLVDRGPKSLPLMKFAKGCVEEEKAIYIKGNHELMLLRFLANPMGNRDLLNPFIGVMDTLESFIQDLLEKGYKEEDLSDLISLVNIINKEYADLINFIRNLPLYHVDGPFAFVHASVEIDKEHIGESHEDFLLWGERGFLSGETHKAKEIVIFGHTPTQNLGANGRVFISKDKKKIGIDGGGFLEDESASVNVVVVDTEDCNKIKTYNYNSKNKTIAIEKLSLN